LRIINNRHYYRKIVSPLRIERAKPIMNLATHYLQLWASQSDWKIDEPYLL